jgi:RNA polymerase sigma factor (TIGR02999 family)
MSEERGTVTLLLRQWREGDHAAFDALVPIVYGELHRIAARSLRRDVASTLRPTDLVSEAYLRLAGGSNPPELLDRLDFFAIAARNMRQILVDHARRKAAARRGGGVARETDVEIAVAGHRTEDLLAIDRALATLAEQDERKARVVELHYFAGLTHDEIAALLEVHVNTVIRDLRFSEAWLRRELSDSSAL